jgi:hypothetical protein
LWLVLVTDIPVEIIGELLEERHGGGGVVYLK